MKTLACGLVLVLAVLEVRGQAYDKLYTRLARRRADTTIPMETLKTQVNVSVGFTLIDVAELNSDNGHAVLKGWMTLQWKDGRLAWKPRKFSNITMINVPSSIFWKPDIVLYNGDMTFTDVLGVLQSDGTLMWIRPATITTRCNISSFLDDSQVACKLKFGSWTYSGNKLNPIISDTFKDNEHYHRVDWALVGFERKRNVQYYSCCPEPYPDIRFNIKFQAVDGQ